MAKLTTPFSLIRLCTELNRETEPDKLQSPKTLVCAEDKNTKYMVKGRVVLFSSRLCPWQLNKHLWKHSIGDDTAEPVKWLLLRKLTCILLPFQLLWLSVNRARKVQLSAAKSEVHYCQNEKNFQAFLTTRQNSSGLLPLMFECLRKLIWLKTKNASKRGG